MEAIASAIEDNEEALRAADTLDIEAATERIGQCLGGPPELTPARVASMAEGLRQVAGLADPIGEITDLRYRPTGIQVGRMRVPLGVIGIIYESRPNVTADAAALSEVG